MLESFPQPFYLRNFCRCLIWQYMPIFYSVEVSRKEGCYYKLQHQNMVIGGKDGLH